MTAWLRAEQSVIGALMIDNTRYDEVATILGAQDFLNQSNALLFQCITGLAENNMPIDLVTVLGELESSGRLGAAGGMEHVGAIARNCPSAANVVAYARVVRTQSRLRHIVTVAERIAHQARQANADPDALLDYATSELTRMISEKEGTGFQPIAVWMKQALEQIETAFQGDGALPGIGSGIAGLDNLTGGFKPGELVVVAGRPSMGKTALALQVCSQASDGGCAGLFSMEMSGAEIAQRLISANAKVNLWRMRNGKVQDEEWPRITGATADLHHRSLMVDDTCGLSAPDIGGRSRMLGARMAREGQALGMIVVDYLQLIRHGNGHNRADAIGETTRALKTLARDLEIPVVLLSQLNRQSENRPSRRPQLSDLRGSGDIEQDADIVVFVHRPGVVDPDTEDDEVLIVAKNRNGPVGDCMVTFNAGSTLFVDRAESRDEGISKARKESYV